MSLTMQDGKYEGLTKNIIDEMHALNTIHDSAHNTNSERNALIANFIEHNPFKAENFNLTRQLQLRKANPEIARILEKVARELGDEPAEYRKAKNLLADIWRETVNETKPVNADSTGTVDDSERVGY